MNEWPFGVGPTRYVEIVVRRSQIPEIGDSIYFERQSDGRVLGLDLANRMVGEVLNEDSVLKLRFELENQNVYFAQVVSVARSVGKIQVMVCWPVVVVPSVGPIRVVLSGKNRHRVETRVRREMGELKIESWLQASFVYRDRYLVYVQEPGQDNRVSLLSPHSRLDCEQRRDACFLWVTGVSRLPQDRQGLFGRAGLIETDGAIEWLSSSAEIPETAEGALALVDTISAKHEYFAIWDRYRDLELQMVKDRTANLQPLTYKGLKYFDDVVRFYLDGGSDTAPWRDSAAGLSALLLLRRRQLHSHEAREEGASVSLGTIRRVESDFVDVDRLDSEIGLPPRGKLHVSALGDKVRLARQSAALEHLRSSMAPIRDLERLLALGVTSETLSFPASGSTARPQLTANGRTLNKRQTEAIAKALATRDICLIQGPPGTGKTEVIRTIVRRLKDEGRRHLLITSHQHAAVDNALEGLTALGVISYRLGGNDSSLTYQNTEIEAWVAQVSESVRASLKHLPEDDGQYAQRKQLKRVVESFLSIQFDGQTYLNHLAEMSSSYAPLIPERLAVEADLLQMEMERILTAALPNRSTDLRLQQFTQLVGQFPLEPDNNASLNVLVEIRTAMEDLLKLEMGSSQLLSRLRQALGQIRHLQPKVRSGLLDRPGGASTRNQLQEAWQIAEESAKKFYDLCAQNTGSTAPLAEGTVQEEWLSRLRQWCTTLADHIKQMERRSRANVPVVLRDWLHDIENHSARVSELFRKHADVWGVTCQQTAAGRFGLFDQEFDYVIVDEAARTGPLDLLIPLVRARRIVLVGDHKQLPHALDYQLEQEIESMASEHEYVRLLKESLFARLYDQLPASKRVRLNQQYRMNPTIAQMVSDVFYGDDPLVSDRTTDGLVNDTDMFNGHSLVWIDIAPDRAIGHERGQYHNQAEASHVVDYVAQLVGSKTPHSIGIITYYAQQRDLIERRLSERVVRAELVEIGTVDAFQGKQKDIILLSMVRSNPQQRLGFLHSPNRLNVSLSRARRLLVILGDASTVTASPYLRSVFEYCGRNGSVIH